uniref:Uncharacterized protein n=1 Tax=Arundo donax TaxID=35708 RepID=A0A0A9BI03_ARUDO
MLITLLVAYSVAYCWKNP